ncbi:MAG: S8 family serine peptidase [Lautropia sp.]
MPVPVPAPTPSDSVVNDPACPLKYGPTDTPMLTGTDPLLAQQWHLNNDASVSGTAGEDVRAFSAWPRTKGEGVRVAVVDDAIEVTHRDLLPNVVPNASYNYRQVYRGNAYPLPCHADDDHGTSVAGLIVARDGNGVGVAGVAPRASLVGYNALATSADADVMDALNRDLANNQIYNNSWGSPDDGFLHPAEPSFVEAIERGINNGRSGKGAIYVFPAGNGGCYNPDLAATPNYAEPCVRENSNYDGYVNKLGVITVCATTSGGKQPWYGENGANMLVCAPSSDIVTSSYVRTTAIGDGFRSNFTGTSASTPMVSGVVAMMLSANPDLTWRDVRLILAQTARKNDPLNADWTSNFGLNFNHRYGFGVVDAAAAVEATAAWSSVGDSSTLQRCGPYLDSVNQTLPDRPPGGIAQPVERTLTVPSSCGITRIEHVEVRITIADHPSTGDLRIRLTSPQGLVSELADEHVCYNAAEQTVSCGRYDDYPFGSVRHLGEPVVSGSNGDWKLTVTDMLAADEGKLASWRLTFYGR